MPSVSVQLTSHWSPEGRDNGVNFYKTSDKTFSSLQPGSDYSLKSSSITHKRRNSVISNTVTLQYLKMTPSPDLMGKQMGTKWRLI